MTIRTSIRPAPVALVLLAMLCGVSLEAQGGRKLDEGFRHALELYAEGKPARAAERFGAMMPMSTRTDTAIHHRWRDRALRLSEERPEILLPILGLYSKVHVQILMQQNFVSAERVLKDIFFLTEQYVIRGGDEVNASASRMVTHVALNLRDWESVFLSIPLLKRAIRLDAGNLAAHLVLINLLEKQGRAGPLAEAINTFLETAPDHPEAQLRAAILAVREGRVDEARQSFSEIVDRSSEPWIVRLAFQENARLAIRQGEDDQALQWIAEGLERFPHEHTLRVLRAFLLRGDLERADEQIVAVASEPWPREPSPRVQYNAWPNKDTHAMRVRLANDITDLLPALAKALSRAPLEAGR